MKISILVQDFDLELLKFIKNSKKKDTIIKNILIAPKNKIHPIRKKQFKIRKITYRKKENKPTFGFKRKFILKIIFYLSQYIYNYRIINLDRNFNFNDKNIFKYTTLLYRYEGIISQKKLNKFKNGLINIHPAILPKYRGLDAGLWALYYNDKLGVSAYLLDKGIDTGPIIKRYFIDKNKFESIDQYRKKLKDLRKNSFLDAVKRYKKNQFEIYNYKILKSQNRGVMSKKILVKLINKLN